MVVVFFVGAIQFLFVCCSFRSLKKKKKCFPFFRCFGLLLLLLVVVVVVVVVVVCVCVCVCVCALARQP